jgi:predicted SAM-dependent methyltransferase
MRLHLGCGKTRLEGYTNVDCVPGAAVDVVADVTRLPFEDGSVESILAEHLIEHLTFYEFNQAMYEWYRLLKPGGVLILECPDLAEICSRFAQSDLYDQYTSHLGGWPLIAQIYGHQRGFSKEEEMSQVHKSGYTPAMLTRALSDMGYHHITQCDPVVTSHDAPNMRIRAVKA